MTKKRVPDAARAWAVMDFIETNPEKHDQGNWFFTEWMETREEIEKAHADARENNWCGTTACFAGWTSLLAGDRMLSWEERRNATDRFFSTEIRSADTGRVRSVRERARDLLGLTESQADLLFDGGNSRNELKRLITNIFGPRPTPKD